MEMGHCLPLGRKEDRAYGLGSAPHRLRPRALSPGLGLAAGAVVSSAACSLPLVQRSSRRHPALSPLESRLLCSPLRGADLDCVLSTR